MKRVWIAIVLTALGVVTALAMPPEHQIIIFGGQSSASGSGGGAGAGSALLADNTNPALLADNTNPACLAGGC